MNLGKFRRHLLEGLKSFLAEPPDRVNSQRPLSLKRAPITRAHQAIAVCPPK
jgi:hypothetical protein